MREFHAKGGPVKTRSFFQNHEIERMCIDELAQAGHLPEEPGPIRIERFVEQRFGLNVQYEDLIEGLLGFTLFGPRGAEAIVISRTLQEDGTKVSERRARTTLAHEAGHALLHAASFMGATKGSSKGKKAESKMLCRDIVGSSREYAGYGGDWMEFQANSAMGSLLLPETLFRKAATPFVITDGFLGEGEVHITEEGRRELELALAETFDVNPVVVRYRLKQVYGI